MCNSYLLNSLLLIFFFLIKIFPVYLNNDFLVTSVLAILWTHIVLLNNQPNYFGTYIKYKCVWDNHACRLLTFIFFNNHGEGILLYDFFYSSSETLPKYTCAYNKNKYTFGSFYVDLERCFVLKMFHICTQEKFVYGNTLFVTDSTVCSRNICWKIRSNDRRLLQKGTCNRCTIILY